jgi:hypothetical protein
VWTLGVAGNGGYQLLRNNIHVGGGYGTLYLWHGGQVYIKNSFGDWFQWNGTTWTSIGKADPSGVTSPPPPPPSMPPPSPPVIIGTDSIKRLSIGISSDTNYIDRTLFAAWDNQTPPHGDWTDKTGLVQGTTPYGSVLQTQGGNFGWIEIPVHISLVTNLITDNSGIWLGMPNYLNTGLNGDPLAIQAGTTTLVVTNNTGQEFSLLATIEQGIDPIQYAWTSRSILMSPVVAKFDMTQITGTPVSAKVKTLIGWLNPGLLPQVIAINKVQGPFPMIYPIVQDPGTVEHGIRGEVSTEADFRAHADVWHYYDMVDLPTLINEWDTVAQTFVKSPYPFDWRDAPDFHTWPTHQNVKAVQWNNRNFASLDQTGNSIYYSPTVTSWRGKRSNFDPRGLQEIYLSYTLLPHADVGDWTHPVNATKLPGMESSNGLSGQFSGWWNMRMQHSLPSRWNPGILRFWPHFYWDQWLEDPNNTGFAQTFPVSDCYLKVGEVNTIEQYIKINSIGQRDGIVQARINGRLAIDLHNCNFRSSDVGGTIDHIFMDIFSGGTDLLNGTITYDVGPVALTKRWAGPLKTTSGGLVTPPPPPPPPRPAFIESMPLNQAVPITTNSYADVVGGYFNEIGYSGGAYVDEPGHSYFMIPAPGGHSIGFWNPVIGVDFNHVGGPQWITFDPGSNQTELDYQNLQYQLHGAGPPPGGESYYYRDGRPFAAHLYGYCGNYAGKGCVVRHFAGASVGADAGGLKYGPQTYDYVNSVWLADNAQTIARMPGGYGPGNGFGCMTIDPRNYDAWFSGNGGAPAIVYRTAINQWIPFGDNCGWSNCGAFIDTIRNRRVFLFGVRPWFGQNDFQFQTQDMATGRITVHPGLPDVSNPNNQYTINSGLKLPLGYEHNYSVHDTVNDLYLYFDTAWGDDPTGAGTYIWEIKPDGSSIRMREKTVSSGNVGLGSVWNWADWGLITFNPPGFFEGRMYGIRTR